MALRAHARSLALAATLALVPTQCQPAPLPTYVPSAPMPVYVPPATTTTTRRIPSTPTT